MSESVGARMRRLRGDLSQDEFASRLGVHKETVGKYERDKMLPGSDVLTRLRQDWRVDINWLLTGEGEGAPVPMPELDSGALAGAIAAIEELLQRRAMILAPDKKGKLVALVYTQLTKAGGGGRLERGMLDALLDLAS